ncbi:NorM family multidrug efflux MATE transporter [Pseudomonas asuensis]|uniref:Multidrug-efflux transporter n=1 Tax=Pseudomonas asuensis TaxID=1825787 RepID=A0ABQ2GRI9_9PSED|nr:NorM family multidrug efflux MATE transporter [Pseudomonas asuensis]GGM09640.1 putative multidrug resistance protein NorM [Pseudomonas asuensis]
MTLLRTELSALARLAIPLITAQLAYVAMVFTDTVMMGRIGPDALASGGLGAATYSFVTVVCVGIIAAVGNLVAIRHGQDDTNGVTDVACAGLWIAVGLSVVAGLILWNLEPVLLALGQAPATTHEAMSFIRTVSFALPGYLVFMSLRGFTSGIGHPGPVMSIAIGGALANLVLNLAFIEGWMGLPFLGLKGIGLITALVMTVMAAAMGLTIRLRSAYAAYLIAPRLPRFNRNALSETLRLGLPIGGTYAVETALFAAAALCMGALGSTQLAAHQIANQLVYVAFMIPVGLAYASSLRVGLHFGAGRFAQSRLAGRIGITVGATCMLAVAIVFWLIPESLVGLFIDPSDPTTHPVLALAVSLLAIAAWFEFFDGIQGIASGALRGIRQARQAMLIGLICYCFIGIVAAWLLGLVLGFDAHGVWWGMALGLACAAVALTWAFERHMRGLLHHEEAESSEAKQWLTHS